MLIPVPRAPSSHWKVPLAILGYVTPFLLLHYTHLFACSGSFPFIHSLKVVGQDSDTGLSNSWNSCIQSSRITSTDLLRSLYLWGWNPRNWTNCKASSVCELIPRSCFYFKILFSLPFKRSIAVLVRQIIFTHELPISLLISSPGFSVILFTQVFTYTNKTSVSKFTVNLKRLECHREP